MLELARATEIHGFAHVTGGGLPGNVHRILPPGCAARIRRGSWPEPPIFAEVQRAGDVARTEMEAVFNLGVGMVAALPPGAVGAALDIVHGASLGAWVIGDVVAGDGGVALVDG